MSNAPNRSSARSPAAGDSNETVARPSGPPKSGTDVFPQIDEYFVIEKLGEGGMGAVYLAEDRKLRRKVAIKTMRPELAAEQANRDRFEREARAAAAVESDYIVPILHVGETADGTPFIVMPFLQGEPLDARLKREPVAGVSLLVKVARDVADGLAAAHAKGLIHRDIKPANIWLEGDPASTDPAQHVRRCKILDFGLARSVDADDANLTDTGAALGTPAYMAPEQARGEKVDHRADLFSLGVTLYRMATGQPPFHGNKAMAVLIAVSTETPPLVCTLAPNLPTPLARLIDRLMCKEPAARPQSAAEVGASVRQIVKDLIGTSAPAVAGASLVPPRLPAVPARPAKPPAVSAVTPRPEPIAPLPRLPPFSVTTRPKQRIAPEPRKRNRALWVIVTVTGLIASGALAAWIVANRDDPADTNAAKPGDEPPSGAPVSGSDSKNEARPKAEPAKVPEVKKDADSDRQAALHVLALKGTVQVNDASEDEDDINDVSKLPPAAFKLTKVSLHQREATDDNLKRLGECKHLRSLDLSETKITDKGLAHLAGVVTLEKLYLGGTEVSDEGLIHLKGFPELRILDLSDTKVRGKGLIHLKDLKWLRSLGLSRTSVTSSGLASVKVLQLESLGLFETPELTDDSLTQLKEIKSLRELHVSTGITPNTRRNDPAQFFGSNITFEGLLEFKKAQPKCRIMTIVWSGELFDSGKTIELTESELVRRTKLKK